MDKKGYSPKEFECFKNPPGDKRDADFPDNSIGGRFDGSFDSHMMNQVYVLCPECGVAVAIIQQDIVSNIGGYLGEWILCDHWVNDVLCPGSKTKYTFNTTITTSESGSSVTWHSIMPPSNHNQNIEETMDEVHTVVLNLIDKIAALHEELEDASANIDTLKRLMKEQSAEDHQGSNN